MIHGMFDRGAMPSLERLVQFTGERHRVLADNIANLSTPNYRPRDLDPREFQASLQEAIAKRRSIGSPTAGKLEMRDTASLRFGEGRIDAQPTASNRNILFHDRNNRDLDRTMQHLAENTLAHNTGIELLRNEFDMLKMAIRERI